MSEASSLSGAVGICSQGVTGAAIERPFEGVLEATAMDCFVALLLAMTYAGAASRGRRPPHWAKQYLTNLLQFSYT